MALKARLRHHERKEASAKKNQRKDTTIKLQDGEIFVDGKISCAIPKIPCCRLGQKLPEDLKEGVRLKCTNEKCIYTSKLVHYQCFEQLEHTLMALLGVQGSARGWTENQKRHNLWEKKGMSLLQRQLRCHCGKGQVIRDSEAWIEREKMLEPEEEKPKKTQKKVKKLPTLNFNQKAPPGVDPRKIQELDYFSNSAVLETVLEDKYGPPKNISSSRIRTVTVNSVSSSITNCSNKPPHFPIGLAPIETKEKKDEPVKQSKILISMPPIVAKYVSSPKNSRSVNAAKTWELFRTKKGDYDIRTSSNSVVTSPENERFYPKLNSEPSQKSNSMKSQLSISNNNSSMISMMQDNVESTPFLLPPTPLNRVIIPSPIKHAADMAEAAGSTMSLTFADYRDFSSSLSETSTRQTCDVGTQTVTTLQDMLYVVTPTGKCIKFDGQIDSKRNTTNIFDENDWSSQLLANATVTAFENFDEAKDRRIDSGCHTRPSTRSPPESSPSNESNSSTKMINNYGFEKLICPPPGFDQFTYPDDSYVPEEESDDNDEDETPDFGPLPTPTNDNLSAFSIWNGPSIGLGERLIELLETGEYKKLGR